MQRPQRAKKVTGATVRSACPELKERQVCEQASTLYLKKENVFAICPQRTEVERGKPRLSS
jgi:hypothetical protein